MCSPTPDASPHKRLVRGYLRELDAANLAALGALLRVENEMSVQRAVLFAARSSPSKTFGPGDLATLEQAYESQNADQADFSASTSEAEQEYFDNTISGSAVDVASAQETLRTTIVGIGARVDLGR